MISVFSIARDLIDDASAKEGDFQQNLKDIIDGIEQDIRTVDITQELSYIFIHHRDFLCDTMFRQLRQERTKEQFRELKETVNNYYELPKDPFRAPEFSKHYKVRQYVQELKLAESQMKWGAKELIKFVDSQAETAEEYDRTLDYYQMLCSMRQVIPFRVARTHTPYDLSQYMTPEEAQFIKILNNKILVTAYGNGTEDTLEDFGQFIRPINQDKNVVYSSFRIEKFDRLREGREIRERLIVN